MDIKTTEEAEAIKFWKPWFEKAGFDGYAIDFSYIKAGVINAMGQAIKDFYEKKEEGAK